MKIARYWARDEAEAAGPRGTFRVRARGWSDESLDAARSRANEIARRTANHVVSGQPSQRYPYGDRPLPEPVLQEFEGALVTRNGYGSLVLNTDQLMMVDIDQTSKAANSGMAKMVRSLFGKSAPEPDPMLARVDAVARDHGLAGRLYQTAAGYRLLITNKIFQPGGATSEELFGFFGADPLYVRLCKLQESFRARLSPKPWRCQMAVPPVAFPFETPGDQAAFAEWQREYDAASAPFATCRFVAAIGFGFEEPQFKSLIEYHDRETKASTALPLA